MFTETLCLPDGEFCSASSPHSQGTLDLPFADEGILPAINAHGRHPQAVPASRAKQPALLVSFRQGQQGWFDAVESPVILATQQVGEPARSFLSRLAARPCHQSIRQVVIVSESSPQSDLGSDRILGILQEGRISRLPSAPCGQHHVTNLNAVSRSSAECIASVDPAFEPEPAARQPGGRLGAFTPSLPTTEDPDSLAARQTRPSTPRGTTPSPQGRQQQESLHRLRIARRADVAVLQLSSGCNRFEACRRAARRTFRFAR